MHVRDRIVHQFADRVFPFLEKAEIFAGEMNLSEINPFELGKSKKLPPGVSLTDLMTEKKYLKVRKALAKSFAFDLDAFKDLHPFLILALIGESQMGKHHAESLDQYLWKRADELGQRMTGLESVEYQMQIMQKIPIETSLRQLKQLARSPKRLRKDIRKMLTYYDSQNIRQLYLLGKKQLQEMKRVLLYDRNEGMAQKIKILMQEGLLFTAFGAGHLAGSKGVLRKLKLMGLKLEPIII